MPGLWAVAGGLAAARVPSAITAAKAVLESLIGVSIMERVRYAISRPAM